MSLDRIDHIGRAERRAAGRHQHGIEHDVARAMALKPVGHDLNDRTGCQHTDLHRIDPHIGEDRIDLLADEFGRWNVNAGDAACVLRRQRG